MDPRSLVFGIAGTQSGDVGHALKWLSGPANLIDQGVGRAKGKPSTSSMGMGHSIESEMSVPSSPPLAIMGFLGTPEEVKWGRHGRSLNKDVLDLLVGLHTLVDVAKASHLPILAPFLPILLPRLAEMG